jgi:hypothetical protein
MQSTVHRLRNDADDENAGAIIGHVAALLDVPRHTPGTVS